MQLRYHDNYTELSSSAARYIAELLAERGPGTICVASGSTPTLAYQLLVEKIRSKSESTSESLRARANYSRWHWLQLDEWGGIPAGGPGTCEFHLRRELIRPLQLDSQFVSWDLGNKSPEESCRWMSAWLDQHGPILASVLGLGLNGHLGFNEPNQELQARPHIELLSEASLGHAMVQGHPVVPTFGVTLGMADLLCSAEIILLVSGPAKRDILRAAFAGPITPRVPASFLQLHRAVTVFTDLRL